MLFCSPRLWRVIIWVLTILRLFSDPPHQQEILICLCLYVFLFVFLVVFSTFSVKLYRLFVWSPSNFRNVCPVHLGLCLGQIHRDRISHIWMFDVNTDVYFPGFMHCADATWLTNCINVQGVPFKVAGECIIIIFKSCVPKKTFSLTLFAVWYSLLSSFFFSLGS